MNINLEYLYNESLEMLIVVTVCGKDSLEGGLIQQSCRIIV